MSIDDRLKQIANLVYELKLVAVVMAITGDDDQVQEIEEEVARIHSDFQALRNSFN